MRKFIIIAAALIAIAPTASAQRMFYGGGGGVDYELIFDGESNDFTITYDEDNDTLDFDGELTFSSGRTHRMDIDAVAATQGVTAPTRVITGTAAGLGFDADAEVIYFPFCVCSDWDGASDMTLTVFWHPESGDAMTDTEDVKWDATYRSIADGEAVDNGTAVTATASYTQSGAGTDKEFIQTAITIDYDDANQPLTTGDMVVVQFDRDVSGESNSYSGQGVVVKFCISYTANKLSVH